MRATKTTKDTAQGIDKIPYSMLHHLSPSNKRALLRLFNTLVIPRNSALSLEKHQHPNNIQRGQHLCFSTSLFSPALENLWNVLCSIDYNISPSFHPHIFAYEKGAGTGDNIAILLFLPIGNDSVVVFLDLETAFELANHDVILHILADNGVMSKLLQ